MRYNCVSIKFDGPDFEKSPLEYFEYSNTVPTRFADVPVAHCEIPDDPIFLCFGGVGHTFFLLLRGALSASGLN